MIKINIPGRENAEITIKNVIFDMNGTLSEDGIIKDDVKILLNELSKYVDIYVVTSDTFGTAEEMVKNIHAKLFIINGENSAVKKREILQKLGYQETIAVGNGFNDTEILKNAIIGIGIMGAEGLAAKAALNCDIIVGKIEEALNLLLNTKRLTATLRN
jgi:soluble P-type ATPase